MGLFFFQVREQKQQIREKKTRKLPGPSEGSVEAVDQLRTDSERDSRDGENASEPDPTQRKPLLFDSLKCELSSPPSSQLVLLVVLSHCF